MILTRIITGLNTMNGSIRVANHPRFEQLYGALSTRGVVEAMYLNVLRRPGDQEGIDFWVHQVDVLGRSISEVFVDFTVGSLEIDLEALFRGGQLAASDYSVAFERQKILENLMSAAEAFLDLFGSATVPTSPIDQLASDPAYNASIAALRSE